MKKDNKAIIITSIIAGVILIIALIGMSAFGNSPYSRKTVTVEGTANINADPDIISVYFSIDTTGETSAEASNANNEILDALILELAKEGFTRNQIKTQNFNIYPNYEYDEGKQTQDGFRATHSLKIELSSEEFETVDEVVDAGINAGTGISYINFELSPELQSQYKAEALELASKDAKIKAEAVASGFDKKVGNLVSVQVSDFGYYPWNVYASSSSGGYAEDAALAREAATDIEPGEQDINARVSATYKIR